jgi:filamentous hemagglutinin family protein
MRRTYSFSMPTLLLSLVLQLLGSFSLWPLYTPIAGYAHAAGPPTAISPTPAAAGGLRTIVTAGSTSTNICAGNCVITGGTRPGGGGNLFHSFGQFNIGAGDITTFQNGISFDANGNALAAGLPTSNILARITGPNGNNPTLSSIYGTLQTSGFGNANLFLMNPAGFLFGPNATINVGGMVSFTSADYLRFGDGKLFNAMPNPNADAILSTVPVAAYGFLGSNPGAITVQGSQLTVTPGISLVGGNITIQSGTLDTGTVQSAKLSAPGGQINLASVASPGEVLVRTLDYAPNVNAQSFGALGTIQLTQKSVLDASGDGGGTVLIRGGRFVIDDSTISANTTGPGIGPLVGPPGAGIDIQVTQDAVIQNGAVLETNVAENVASGIGSGGVRVTADHIEIVGILPDFSDPFAPPPPFTGIRSNVAAGSTGGKSGDILLEANSILLKDFVHLETLTGVPTEELPSRPATGDAGNITVKANQNLEINFGIIRSSTAFGSGNAGNIDLTSTHGNILLTNLSDVSSQSFESSGNVGTLTLGAPNGDIVLSDQIGIHTNIQGPGGAAGSGGIHVTAKNLTLLNLSVIAVDNFVQAIPGDITVNLSGRLSLDGQSVIATETRGTALGAAALNITAHDMSVTGDSILSTESRSTGPGGQMNIFTDNLQLTNGGQLRSGSGRGEDPFTGESFPSSGAGGTINIQGLAGPTPSILIDGTDSGFFTNTVGTGAGGNINILANSLTLQNGGSLSAATTGIAPSATGGIITLNAEHVAVNSQAVITTETNGIAPAGVIDINTGSLAINSGGQIRSSSGAETEQVSAFALSSTAAPSLTGGTISIQGQTGNGSQADSVTIDGVGSGIFTQSTGNRPGGDINMLTSQSVALTNGASVSASSTGTGNAGNIQINAGNQLAMTNSTVTTEASQSSGGAIKITTNPNGTVQLTDSTISASVNDGTGGGGSVNIDPESVVLINSQILANAVFGPGGNINITTNLLLPDSTSVISASSQFGQQGTVIIQSPISPASGKIVPLGQKPLLATTLLSQRCAAIAGGNISSFTIAGRDSLPAEPGGWVSSPLALSMVESNESAAAETAFPSYSEMAEGTPLLSLRKIAPPGFLTQSFAPNGSTDCTS